MRKREVKVYNATFNPYHGLSTLRSRFLFNFSVKLNRDFARCEANIDVNNAVDFEGEGECFALISPRKNNNNNITNNS